METPKGGALKGGAPKGGAPNFGGPKISLFFLPLPTPFSFFLPSWGSFRGILVVFGSAGALKCARLEFPGCRVKRRRPQEAPALSQHSAL